MPSITVKNIPESIYNKLKKQADAQHRSMNSEIITCLERAVEPKVVSPDEILRQARMMRKKVIGSLSAEEIQDAIKQGRS
ncbi:Arc family DNA-binding protein [Balneolaceae bacterium ANBcel3]|nr:Arc family DNA-binding protein [Balneolaceae bacterium ANBcel3]